MYCVCVLLTTKKQKQMSIYMWLIFLFNIETCIYIQPTGMYLYVTFCLCVGLAFYWPRRLACATRLAFAMRSWPLFLPTFALSLSLFFCVFCFWPNSGKLSGVFSSFYGQRSVTAAWATPSPWSILLLFHLLLLTHFGETPEADNLFSPIFWHN